LSYRRTLVTASCPGVVRRTKPEALGATPDATSVLSSRPSRRAYYIHPPRFTSTTVRRLPATALRSLGEAGAAAGSPLNPQSEIRNRSPHLKPAPPRTPSHLGSM